MASFVYNSVLTDLVNSDIDFGADSFKMMLVTSSYAASKSAHDKRNDVTNEVSGTGYTAGGNAVVCSLSDDTNKKIITFAAVSWPSASFTTAGAVVYKARGGSSSLDELVFYLDFNGSVTSAGGTFSVSASVINLTN